MNKIVLQAVFLFLIALTFYVGYAELSGVTIEPMPGHAGSAVKEFTIKAFQYGFDPSSITVNQHDTVVLNVIDVDVPHGIGIAEFGVITRSTEIGKPVKVSFVADKVGTFAYFCSVYCGEGHESMVSGNNKGLLIVKPVGESSKETQKIYVANEGDGTISVIDSEMLEVVKTIKLGGMPHNVNVDPLGRYVYVTNDGEMDHTPYLRIIDAKTNEVVKSVPMSEMAAHAVPNKNGNRVYVSIEGGNSIVEVNVEQGKIERTFVVGEGPHGFVLSNDGKMLYVPNMRSNDVSSVDLTTGNVEKLSVSHENNHCETPVAMGITPDDRYSFVTCGKSFEIYKIDNNEKTIIGRVEFQKGEFPGPIQTPVHPDGKYLYVPDMRNGVVHKIDVKDFKLIKDIRTGEGAHGIAFSSDGKTAYVTNTWENTLAILDLESDTVIKKIPVGTEPNGVAVSNGKNQGW